MICRESAQGRGPRPSIRMWSKRSALRACRGRRGFTGAPLHKSCRTPTTGTYLLTDKQDDRLRGPVRRRRAGRGRGDQGGIYKRKLATLRGPSSRARPDSQADQRPQHQPSDGADRADHAGLGPGEAGADVLIYFDRPGTSLGPTEALNGRLEHLRGSPWTSRTRPISSPEACSNPAVAFRPQLLHPQSG